MRRDYIVPMMCEWWYAGIWNTRRGLKPKSTNYPDHGHHGNLSLQGKFPMVEPGIEPGTSWLVVRDPDHQTTRLVSSSFLETRKFPLSQKPSYGLYLKPVEITPQSDISLSIPSTPWSPKCFIPKNLPTKIVYTYFYVKQLEGYCLCWRHKS